MIHPSRLPARRPPTVAELIQQLSEFPQDAIVVIKCPGTVAQAPLPQAKTLYRDETGSYYTEKVNAQGRTTFVKGVAL